MAHATSTLIAAALVVTAVAPSAGAPGWREYPIRAVPLTAVKITGGFWRARLDTNRTVTIPHIVRQNEITGRVDNFLKAARALGRPTQPLLGADAARLPTGAADPSNRQRPSPAAYKGHRYDDTDIYKIIEAAAYSLATHPDAALDRKVDELIAIVAAAQEPDGYLYAARTADPLHPAPGAGPSRWSWLHTSHELYNQGHLYEAAVAHHEATGKRSLLDVAIKSADLVTRTFGPDGRRDVPGHEEIELALVKLARVTGNRKYLDTARYFIEQRGRPHEPPLHEFAEGDPFRMYNDLAYRQDAAPVDEQTRAVGHAVRAVYLYSGMTDVAALFGLDRYANAVRALWQDVVSKRMYLTGGLGSVGGTEAFGDDYVLPNRAYAETCASVGGILWYHRMFLRDGDPKYYDTLEQTLYNGYLSGVSLAGDTFFYQNPLVSTGGVERSAYFEVACCPANLARLMAQLPGLIYAQRDREIFVNLFIASEATLDLGGTRTQVSQTTEYPWEGRVAIRVRPDAPVDATLAIRIPGWAHGAVVPSDLYRLADEARPAGTVRINGEPAAADDHGFVRIHRRWTAGDVVEIDLAMPVRRVLANEQVTDDRGKSAIVRGPIVYALEQVDNGDLDPITLPLDAQLTSRFDPALLGGVAVVTGDGRVGRDRHSLVAIPYYAWNNRGKGQMEVWIPHVSPSP